MRRRQAEKQQLTPDIRYNSEIVTKFINYVMERGKKSLARKLVYGAFDAVAEQNKDSDALEIFLQALENVKPRLEVKARRVGGATYQVPVEIPPERQESVALNWIIGYARGRSGVSMKDALAAELMDAYQNTGSAVRRRDEMHKMAAANKAFAHFRW